MKRSILAAALLLLVLLSACSLAEDVTPPPGYQTPAPITQEIVYPIVPPDLAQGAVIFAEKCASCHGDAGRGNGAAASSLPVEVPAIGRSEVALSARPADWFDVVTNGRMERSMPPFKSLSDRDRWDVVAYALSLHTGQARLDSAKVIFEEQCQGCHGSLGKGDGARSASLNVPDWSHPERLALLSEAELFQTITGGSGGMPAYRESLDDAQRLALAAFVRSLTFSSPGRAAGTSAVAGAEIAGTPVSSTGEPPAQASGGTPAPAATGTGTPAEITLSGRVTNASGSDIPAGLEATLRAFDAMQPAFTRTVSLAADGSYRFEGVETAEGRVFLVTITVRGVDFNSDPLHSADLADETAAELPVTIYDVSSDATLLHGDRLHVFFDFSDPQMVQVVELLIFSNPTRQVIAPAAEGGTILNFELPAGASDLQFQDGQLGDGTYVDRPDGFGVAQVYPPAEGYQVLFAYNLPYKRKGTFELRVPLDVAETVVMAPQEGVRMKSDQLTDAGARPVQGINLQLFTAGDLRSATPLKLSLSGRPPQGAQVNTGSTMTLLAGIGAFVLVGAGAAVYFFRRREETLARNRIEEEETPETLMDAIIALDDERRAGELNEEVYLARRSELKQRLKTLLNALDRGKGAE